MKGFKVVQCIEIDSYALFMAAGFPKDQKEKQPDHEKTCLKGFPTRLYSNSSMLSYIKKTTRVLNFIRGICV